MINILPTLTADDLIALSPLLLESDSTDQLRLLASELLRRYQQTVIVVSEMADEIDVSDAGLGIHS